MPVWMAVVIALVVLAGCVLYISWFGGQLVREMMRRRELKRWDAGLLERLAATGTDESRLDELRRLHGIVDARLHRLGTTAPSLRDSLDKAMYLRTTQPELVRRAVGGRKLPSVAAITRLMDRLDTDDRSELTDEPSVPVVTTPTQPVPATLAADASKSRRKAWRLISENPLVATVVGGLTVALVLYVIHLAVEGGSEGSAGTPTAPLVDESDGATWLEQAGAGGARTFIVPAGASEGPRVRPNQHVKVACKVYKPEPESVMPDGYWYRLDSSPWRGRYYAPANSFWNGDHPGHRPYTHNTDFAVPDC